MSSLLGRSLWFSAILLPSWDSSVWDPGYDRGTGLGCPLGALVFLSPGRLVLAGAEAVKEGHLV